MIKCAALSDAPMCEETATTTESHGCVSEYMDSSGVICGITKLRQSNARRAEGETAYINY